MKQSQRGRPRKEPKTKLNLRIRPAVLRRFRRFIGTAQIFCEAVERAMIHEMERQASHGT